jgi:hypothetical protein
MSDLGITSPVLQRLHGDWVRRLRGREMPSRSDFDVLDLKYILGNINLLDVERDPLRFRFRVHGTNAVDRLGVDMTGKTVDDYDDPGYRALVNQYYAGVVETRRPLRVLRDPYMLREKVLCWEGLILPLSEDGRTVNMLMVGIDLF